MMRPQLYFYILAIVGVALAILAAFNRSLFNRLSVRIAVLILLSGPITFLLYPFAIRVLIHIGLVGPPDSFSALTTYALITLGVPAVLGLVAALYVRRPLRKFSEAIASLGQNDYKVQLRPTGIQEFDKVFTKFNDLIARLHHEEKLRKDLVSDTSHELNTPLTTMIGQLTAMQEGKHAMTMERITMLKEQTERLAELVQQLDAYTKARTPNTAKPEDIQLKQFCEQLIAPFSSELKQKGIATMVSITGGLIVHANRDALQKILTNLMQNTIRYSDATMLTITATTGQLTFSDNGKGVPPDSLPYLFERFYRVDASRQRETGGLGLGLAIVKELAEQQEWSIRAEDAKPGLSFVVTF